MVAALSGKHDSQHWRFLRTVVSIGAQTLFLSPLRLVDLPNVLVKITRANFQTSTTFPLSSCPLKKKLQEENYLEKAQKIAYCIYV